MDLKHVVIVGGGPAGCTLGTLLARRGLRVTLFDTGKRPELIVGESMIPAILPLLAELEILEEVEKIGRHKPGASMFFPDGQEWRLAFSSNGEHGDHYAFNVPRREFDAIFRDLALKSGCEIRESKALIRAENDRVYLEELPSASFIVDATGRMRAFSKALGIKSVAGKRKDIALFAHCSEAQLPHGGNIHMGISEHGWSWRIPLVDRVSVGVVAPQEYLQRFGKTDEERYDALLARCEFLAPYLTAHTERLTPVAKYSNYQLTSDRLFGENWALVGDAAGFIDPVFSGGAYLSVSGAKRLADALLSGTLLEYEERYRRHLFSWQALVDSFYDGRFFKMIYTAHALQERSGKEMHGAREIVCRIVSGVSIESPEVLEMFRDLLDACGYVSSLHPKPLSVNC